MNGLGGEPAGGQHVAAAFGYVLRAVRQEAGVTQEDLAFRAEVDRTYPSLESVADDNRRLRSCCVWRGR